MGKGVTLGIIAAAVVVAAAATYFLILNLIVPQQVNESPATTTQVNEPAVSVDMASQVYHKYIGMSEQDRMRVAAQMTPQDESMILTEAARVTTGIKESVPGMKNQSVSTIRSGSFAGVDGHLAEGIAKIVSVNGTQYLRFEHFKVTNGPDLHIYLVSSAGNVQNRIDLGILKGSEGDQNYSLGSGHKVQEAIKYKSCIALAVKALTYAIEGMGINKCIKRFSYLNIIVIVSSLSSLNWTLDLLLL